MSLDLARTTGFCVGVPFQRANAWSTRLDGDTRGERYLHLKAILLPLFVRYEPAVCFIEEPLDPNFAVKVGITRDTMMGLNGYVAVAEMLCAQMEIKSVLVERKLALAHFTGRNGYKEENGAKKACVARCHQLKYTIDGYDAADAAAQWDYGCAQIYQNAYAMVRSTLPQTMKGYDDARLPGNRGITRRRKPKRKRSTDLFGDRSD